MDATISYEDRPLREGARNANPYSRTAWSRPGDEWRGERDRPHFQGRRAASSNRRGASPHPLGASAFPGRLREGLRIVPLVAAVGFAVFVLMGVFQMATMYADGLGLGDSAGAAVTDSAAPAVVSGDGAEAASTPKSQWRAGEMPFLYQIDPQYGAAPYAGADVEESGCGPTSLSMVYVALTGKTDYDPAAMAAFSEAGGFVEDGLTAWRLMTEGAAQLGLASHEVPADASCLTAELEAGRPVICTVRPGDFTDTGHFLVVAGVADNGELVIHDPNSPANSARTWDVQRVLSQCANLWAFEKA